MPSPDRAEILSRAEEGFREQGRGYVVLMNDRGEPHDGFLDELRESLADEPDAETLIKATEFAVEVYVSEKEAIVIDSRPEEIYVMVVWDGGTLMVGGIDWAWTT
jgi:hypothetical protein